MSTRIETATGVQPKSHIHNAVAPQATDRLPRKLYIGEWIEEAVSVAIVFADAGGTPRLPLSFSGRLRYG